MTQNFRHNDQFEFSDIPKTPTHPQKHIMDFSAPEVNLRDQLMKFSTLSHISFHHYRLYGTKFLPGQLYHDLQRMVQGAYYSCVLLKHRGGGKMLYISWELTKWKTYLEQCEPSPIHETAMYWSFLIDCNTVRRSMQ